MSCLRSFENREGRVSLSRKRGSAQVPISVLPSRKQSPSRDLSHPIQYEVAMAASPATLGPDHSAVRDLHVEQIEDLIKLQKAAQKISSILDLDELIDRKSTRLN